ncbi:MAG TPA: glycosyltransferase family 2 protein [Candidatus Saccharibacteria bacterium]|nr:glycosyltransferase family 2 protein [Candidatus Saccharibacteria bacterium]HMT56150.1 glycosyltransferase family 2 protein [Candidatus Saccharibacteria bacterium]
MELLMYSLGAVSVLTELLLVLKMVTKRPFVILVAVLSMLSGGFSAGSLLTTNPSIAVGLYTLIQMARFTNPLRFVEKRMNEKELISRTRRSFMVLTPLMIVNLIYIWRFDNDFAFPLIYLIIVSAIMSVFTALSTFITRAIFRYRKDKVILQEVLPTVSICIPARNETADLPLCLESVLASTYPKLEILVLDDCSHDKTPEIIKKYAHDGVRFINGKEPDEDWVAKNAAYDRLADEARGEILLFIGVDVRLAQNAVTELVQQLGTDSMLSVLPRRSAESESAFFIQPIRYWWELGLWRFTFQHPPVLSTCWLIRRDVLNELGTFESVKKAVEPEAVFARALYRQKKYAFLVANEGVGVESSKIPHDQYITALRKRYSQLKRRPENVLLLAGVELLLLLPWIAIIVGFLNDSAAVFSICLFSITLLSTANALVFKLALRKLWPLGFLSFPLLLVADIALSLRSFYSYEFGQVIWKERNICLPLLTVEKSLPKI